MSQISSTVTAVVVQTFDGDICCSMLCCYLYVFKDTYQKQKQLRQQHPLQKKTRKLKIYYILLYKGHI